MTFKLVSRKKTDNSEAKRKTINNQKVQKNTIKITKDWTTQTPSNTNPIIIKYEK